MADSPPPVVPAPDRPKKDRTKVILLALVVGICALNGILFLRSCRNLPGEIIDKTGQAIEKTGRVLTDLAAAFKQGRVKTEFISYATSVSNQQHFQFATLKQNEIFTRTEETSTAFGYIPLPDVIVEARAPVEYAYYLDLNERWDFVLKDGVLYVFAPAFRFNKPSVDASAITYEVRKGVLKTAEAQENLKRSVSSLVMHKARENIPLIRETGRRQTTEFVERWLTRSFTDGQRYPVKVFFPGEKPPDGVTSNGPPP